MFLRTDVTKEPEAPSGIAQQVVAGLTRAAIFLVVTLKQDRSHDDAVRAPARKTLRRRSSASKDCIS